MKTKPKGGASDKIVVLPKPLPVDELILLWKMTKHLTEHPDHDYSHVTNILESMSLHGLNIVVTCYVRMAKADDSKALTCRKVALMASRMRDAIKAA